MLEAGPCLVEGWVEGVLADCWALQRRQQGLVYGLLVGCLYAHFYYLCICLYYIFS